MNRLALKKRNPANIELSLVTTIPDDRLRKPAKYAEFAERHREEMAAGPKTARIIKCNRSASTSWINDGSHGEFGLQQSLC